MKQQFRVVILDYYDNVINVEHESGTFGCDRDGNAAFGEAVYRELLELNSKYNLVDCDNVPPMEYQRRVTDEDGKFCGWVYMSNPIEDFYNL